jgi:excinuclease UvrABC nuclease subunit
MDRQKDCLSLSESTIRGRSHKLQFEKGVPGVYFLLDEEEIVYIGKSAQCCYSRLKQHLVDDKEFDAHYVYGLDPDENDLHEIEAELIYQFQPTLNSRLPPNDTYTTVWKLSQCVHGFGEYKTRRFLREVGAEVRGDWLRLDEATKALNKIAEETDKQIIDSI